VLEVVIEGAKMDFYSTATICVTPIMNKIELGYFN